jgi:hypothetical protein
MTDFFDDAESEGAPAPQSKLEEWVGRVTTGLAIAPWLLLSVAGGAVFALVSLARELARSQPRIGGPLVPLAIVGGLMYAVMGVGLVVGGVALQGRREWARRLLVGLASVYRIVWLGVLAWCLSIIVWSGLQYREHRWSWTAADVVEGLAIAAVGALALSVYMTSIRRALRSPAIIAACAGESAWAEALRARDEWAAALLSPHGAPTPSGRYPESPSPLSVAASRGRLLSGLFLPALVALALAAWTEREWGIDWRLAAWPIAGGAWEGGRILYRGLRSVVSLAWDQEEVVLRRRLGTPVRVPWAALDHVELKLPPEPRSDGTTPPFPARLFLRRGRPFEVVMKLDTDAGQEFLDALLHRTTATEAPAESWV